MAYLCTVVPVDRWSLYRCVVFILRCLCGLSTVVPVDRCAVCM